MVLSRSFCAYSAGWHYHASFSNWGKQQIVTRMIFTTAFLLYGFLADPHPSFRASIIFKPNQEQASDVDQDSSSADTETEHSDGCRSRRFRNVSDGQRQVILHWLIKSEDAEEEPLKATLGGSDDPEESLVGSQHSDAACRAPHILPLDVLDQPILSAELDEVFEEGSVV